MRVINILLVEDEHLDTKRIEKRKIKRANTEIIEEQKEATKNPEQQ